MRKLALSDDILLKIEKPARYIGNEVNSIMKDKEQIAIRFAMCFPDVYEIGMLDTYEKYKKGYIINDDAKEYEENHKEATKKLDKILEKAKNRKDFAWLNEIPEVKQENNPTYQGEEI